MTLRQPCAAAFLLAMIASSAQAETPVEALSADIAPRAREVLTQIPDNGRKLLALRSYLRSHGSINKRWSWTQAEIDAYLKSDPYVTAMAAVAAVIKAFEVKNPGHTLRVNTDIRSLDEQIGKWNSNGSVSAAGAALDGAYKTWIAGNPKANAEALGAFLKGWQPGTTVMLAAPGLTAHGRGEAFDFQVLKDGKVVAGADSGSISGQWRDGGWSARLQEAVKLSTMPFDGPLKDPDEPWHYDYNPPAAFVPAVVAAAPPAPEQKPEPEKEADQKQGPEQAGPATAEADTKAAANGEVAAASPDDAPQIDVKEAQADGAATPAEDPFDPGVVPAPMPAPRVAMVDKPATTAVKKTRPATSKKKTSTRPKAAKPAKSTKAKGTRKTRQKTPAWMPPFLR
ncbi:MAG: hypothetical protein WBA44_13645 [Mesorhizobium sp.]